jgi:hypothetical protein
VDRRGDFEEGEIGECDICDPPSCKGGIVKGARLVDPEEIECREEGGCIEAGYTVARRS